MRPVLNTSPWKKWLQDNQQGYLQAARDLLFVSGGNFAAQLIMMVYTIVLARALGPALLGEFNGIYAIVGLSITLVNWGLDTWMLNESRHFGTIQKLVGSVLTVKLLTGIIWAVGLLVILPVLRPDSFSLVFALFVLADVFCEIIFNSLIAAWNILKDIKKVSFMLLVSRTSKFLLLLLLIYQDLLTPTNIAITRFLVSVTVMGASLYLIKPLLFGENLCSYQKILKKSTPYGYSEILAVIYGNADVAILTLMTISTNVGFYSAASGVIHALFVIPNSIFSLLVPKYSQKFLHAAFETKKRDIYKIIGLYIVMGAVLALTVFFGGSFVIEKLLGEAYQPTGGLLTILSPILFLKSLEFGLAIVIVIFGMQGKRLLPQIIAAVFSILGTILTVPVNGIYGVSWVYVASEVILALGYLFLVIKILKRERE